MTVRIASDSVHNAAPFMAGSQRVICRDPVVDHFEIRGADRGGFYLNAYKSGWRSRNGCIDQPHFPRGFDAYSLHGLIVHFCTSFFLNGARHREHKSPTTGNPMNIAPATAGTMMARILLLKKFIISSPK